MIEMRCRHNRKAAEFDPDTLTVWIPCKTCKSVWGRPVSHPWPLAELIRVAAAGQGEGIVRPTEAGIPSEVDR